MIPDITAAPPLKAGPLPDGEDRKPPDLARLKRMVSEAQSLTSDARLESLTDVDYYDGHQLTAAERKALAARGQPDIVINRARAAINGILGVTEQGESEPRAFPRNPDDEDSADTATDVLRYVAEKNRFSRLKQDCFLDMLVPGSTAVLVGVNDDKDVTLEQIRFEELLYDPKSRRKDFSDARYMGIAKWMYADDAMAMYPAKKAELESIVAPGGIIGDASFMDRPDNGQMQWVDSRSRRILMVELYYREGGWKRCVFHSGGIVEEGDSPYNDDKGRPCNPIEAQSAYVDRNNNRYGAMRDMRGPQDEINKRRSKLLHLLTVSQIQATAPNAIAVDADAARKEAARPDGVIPLGWQKVPTNNMAEGQAELLAEAKDELERLGPNPAILGRQGSDSSGRALLARQQAGMVELAVLFGSLEDWELRIYRQCWSRAKQFWTAPMWIRVTDDEDSPKFVGLNQPKGAPQPVMGQDGQPQMGPDGQPVTQEGPPLVHPPTYPAAINANDNQLGQFAGMPHPLAGQPHPQAGQAVLGYKNVVGEMDVDITIESTPQVANIQAEQFQDLMQLVSSSPIYQQQVPLEVLIGLSAVPHKRQVIDQIKTASAQAQQAQQAAQQQAMQMQAQQAQVAMATEQARANDLNSKAGLNQVTAQTKQADTILKANQQGHQQVVDASTPPPGVSGAAAA